MNSLHTSWKLLTMSTQYRLAISGLQKTSTSASWALPSSPNRLSFPSGRLAYDRPSRERALRRSPTPALESGPVNAHHGDEWRADEQAVGAELWLAAGVVEQRCAAPAHLRQHHGQRR